MLKQNPILFSIVIIGFLLRIIGTSPGYYAHGYEVMYGQAVLMILNKTIGLEYNNLAYPPLVAWIMAAIFLFFFVPLSWIGYYMRIGFQADEPSTTFYLDEVEIYQTKEKLKIDGVKPYLIKDEDFFNPSDSSFI